MFQAGQGVNPFKVAEGLQCVDYRMGYMMESGPNESARK